MIFAVLPSCANRVLVIALYSKAGGKGGRHDWVPQLENIGQLSYAVVRTYQHTGSRSFRCIHRDVAMIGVSMFAHLASGAILVHIEDTVSVNERGADLSKKTAALYVELQNEKSAVMQITTALTTVQKESANVNILDIEEDDGVDK
ncbi:hypothetical protein GGX14DRAFT_375313 [Mycena pura]|uniref:Uncharacterized protein n=1 Tax=Mycena pura TaxID=153505 RepID=A0AAD6Y3G6_9AGAR|nr:hypothetical protein GGX14DRAFT_375313 [Mycena pura]